MAKELFTPINRKIGDLLTDIKVGRIGLPDLQRQFVWKDNKVRELLDSMLKKAFLSDLLCNGNLQQNLKIEDR